LPNLIFGTHNPDGWLAMLTAYFDDSGTHAGSDIVLVAGIFGTEGQLTSLERLWQPHIDNPICGQKPRLRRFHATDCYNSQNEFAGWSRTETDYFFHQLQTAIIDSGVSAYGIAVSRQDWDEIVTGGLRGFLGDAEGYAITQCFVCTVRWAQRNAFDPKITFIFDNRPSEIQRHAKAIGDAFEKVTQVPQITGTAFLSSYDITPLQAADLFAWEVYQHANEIFASGVIQPPKRQALRRLDANMKMQTQFANREAIQNIADYIRAQPEEYVRAAADHFRNFDPSNPDYSRLSGRQPS
jgi:hypothetical protein